MMTASQTCRMMTETTCRNNPNSLVLFLTLPSLLSDVNKIKVQVTCVKTSKSAYIVVILSAWFECNQSRKVSCRRFRTSTSFPVYSEMPRWSLQNETGTRSSLNCSIFEPLRCLISEVKAQTLQYRCILNSRHSSVDETKVRQFAAVFVLTRAVGLREDWCVTEIILQCQVSDTVQTSIGWKTHPQCMTGSKHSHQPRWVAFCAARAAAWVDGGRVRQRDARCSLRTERK